MHGIIGQMLCLQLELYWNLGARMGFKVLDPIAAVIVSILIIKVGVDLYMQSIRD